MQLTQEYVIVNVSVLHYGKGPSNPLDDVIFYSRQQPDIGRKVDPSDVSVLTPSTFAEVWLRVYTKDCQFFGLIQAAYRHIIRMLPPSEAIAASDEHPEDKVAQYIVSLESLPIPTNAGTISPSFIPVSPPSSAMLSVDSSIKPASVHGEKRKRDAPDRELDTMSASAQGSSAGSLRQCSERVRIENVMQWNLIGKLNDNAKKMLGAFATEGLHEALILTYELEKNLSEDNLVRLQMLLEDNPVFVMGYRHAATRSARYRMRWVKTRLECVGCDVPEYADLEGHV
ncbi:hypothetical protein EDC04DRAFT_2718522 [Pisolithus marmoratus]|nr:hypothetical protein EDC04DRAFT_2718522 [Pisolithus marmoratus]